MPSSIDYMDNLPLLFSSQLLSITHALQSCSLLLHPFCKCRHTYALVLYKLVRVPGFCDSKHVSFDRIHQQTSFTRGSLAVKTMQWRAKQNLGASC